VPAEKPGDAPLTALRALTIGSELALNLVVPLIFGIVAGKYLDAWMHSSPIALVSGLFFGLAMGIYNSIRFLMRLVSWK